MKSHETKVADAQRVLHGQVKKLLDKHGTEATLEAMATQLGVLGAAAVICGAIRPVDFAGKHLLRALAVCDQTAKDHYIEGVLQ